MERIVIFIPYFFPGSLSGGPALSVDNISRYLSNHFRVYIVTRCHDYGQRIDYQDIRTDQWLDIDNVNIMYVSRGLKSYLAALLAVRRTSPSVIYLNSVFGLVYSFVPYLFSTVFGFFPTVRSIIISPRGELDPAALDLKAAKKGVFLSFFRQLVRFFAGMTFFHSTSRNESLDISNVLKLPSRNIFQIPNIPRSPTEHTVDPDSTLMSVPLRIVFLSRIVPKKNLCFAINILAKVKSGIIFDIYGPIHDKNYWKECMSAASALPTNIGIRYRGPISSEQVPFVLSQYSLMLFPTLGENYGHVIYESLNSACPVLISDKTPWHQSVLGKAGWALDLKRPEMFSSLIDSLSENRSMLEEASRQAISVARSHYYNDYSTYIKLFSMPYDVSEANLP